MTTTTGGTDAAIFGEVTMTANQWRLLDILETWGGLGTIEVEIQFGDYDFGDTEADEAKGFRVTRMVVAGLMRTLINKGFAVHDENGYGITTEGQSILNKHRERMRQT